MSKAEPTTLIAKIVAGAEDTAGNPIVYVLAKGNEYAIYEIDHQDINNRLRVAIDGHSDKAEQQLVQRFKVVKQKYIEAKGLLYRSQNFGMMKNRVAHALASVLSSTKLDENPTLEFETLIADLKRESEQLVLNRLLFILPAILAVILGVISLNYFGTSSIALVIFGAALGGALSVSSTLSKKHFEEFKYPYYLALGAERIFLANVAAAIAFALVKAELVLPSLATSNPWLIISLAIVAGFSEQLVPSLLNKVSSE